MKNRGDRRTKTENIKKNRFQFLRKMFGGNPVPDQMSGRCKKHHPHDCGKADCYCCHCDKLDDIKTKQEIDAELKLKEFHNGSED